jgi:hypothetical protein
MTEYDEYHILLLEDIFYKQKFLMGKYKEKGLLPEFPLDLTKKEDVSVIEHCSFHLMKELFEAVSELKNRPNRKTNIEEYDREKYKEEIIDAFHLLIEFCILSGISCNELYEKYCEKNKKNLERIENGY